MKKKILITIAVVIVILIVTFSVIIGHFVKSDLTMESDLTKEITEINLLIENNSKDTSSIDQRLNTINTSGDYVLVEKAAKRYLKDKKELFTSLYATLDNTDKIEKVLTIENIKADAKNFTNTMNLLNTTGLELTSLREKYVNLTSEKTILSYLNKNLREDDYYKKYYLNELMQDMTKNEEDLKAIDDLLDTIVDLKEVFNFLITNQNNWNIENDKIMFSSEELYNTYKQLLTSISEETKTTNNI